MRARMGRAPTVAEEMEWKRKLWAMMQTPDINAFPALMQMLDHELIVQNGSGTRVVMSRECMAMLKTMVKEGVQYYSAGADGMSLLTSDITDRMPLYGRDVFVMTGFRFPRSVFVHPLDRVVQIGGYVPMYDESAATRRPGKYSSRERSRFITDMPSGNVVEITLEDAVRNCQLFDFGAYGDVATPPHDPASKSGFTDGRSMQHFTWRTSVAGFPEAKEYIGELLSSWRDAVTGEAIEGLSTATRTLIGKSLYYGTSFDGGDASKDLASVQQLLQFTAKATYDSPDVQNWLALLAEELAAAEPRLAAGASTAPKDYGLYFLGTKVGDRYVAATVPPGFDSWEGLKAMAAQYVEKMTTEYGEAGPKAVTNVRHLLRGAHRFVMAFDRLMTHAQAALGSDDRRPRDPKSYCAVFDKTYLRPAGSGYGEDPSSLAFDTVLWHCGPRAFVSQRPNFAVAARPAVWTPRDVLTATTRFVDGLAGFPLTEESLAAFGRERVVPSLQPGTVAALGTHALPLLERLLRMKTDMTAVSAAPTLTPEHAAIMEIVPTQASLIKTHVAALGQLRSREEGQRAASELNDAIRRIAGPTVTVEQFLQEYCGAGLCAPPARGLDPAAANFYATALRVSRAMAESLAALLSAAGGRVPEAAFIMPADDREPGLVMAPERLLQIMAEPALKDEVFPPADRLMCQWRQSGLYREMRRVLAGREPPMSGDFERAFNAQAAEPGVKLHNAAAQLVNCTRLNGNALLSMIKYDVRVPIGAIAARPHRTYVAQKMVLAGDFGGAATRDGNAVVGDDPVRHVHLITADMMLGTFVTSPENIVGAPGVFVRGYVRGEDTTAIAPGAGYRPDNGLYGGSIVYIAVPADWRKKPTNLNLQGNMYLLRTEYATTDAEVRELAYPTAPYYNIKYGWRANNYGSKTRMNEDDAFLRYPEPINVFCRQEWHLRNNPDTGMPTDMVPGEDFWAPSMCYPNCGAARQGGVFDPKPMRGVYSLVS
jgi:hypothetical protein